MNLCKWVQNSKFWQTDRKMYLSRSIVKGSRCSWEKNNKPERKPESPSAALLPGWNRPAGWWESHSLLGLNKAHLTFPRKTILPSVVRAPAIPGAGPGGRQRGGTAPNLQAQTVRATWRLRQQRRGECAFYAFCWPFVFRTALSNLLQELCCLRDKLRTRSSCRSLWNKLNSLSLVTSFRS